MSYHLNVKGLAGLHIGQHVTVKTKHTEASGVLQGFRHDTETINDSSFGGKSWALGQTQSTITLVPDQRIVATMEDEVVVHGYDAPEPVVETPDGGDIPKVETTGPAWKVSDPAIYCGMIDGKHVYMTPENAERWGIQGQPVTVVADEPRICDNTNAAHQAEKNGEIEATAEFPQGPRTVEVLHGPSLLGDYSRGYIKYGQAITGWPILKATVTEEPRNDSDREWLETYLPAYITPYGEIIHAYNQGKA